MITDIEAALLFWGEPFMLLAGRFLMSAAWPDCAAEGYFWEHCHWVDNSDFTNNAQMSLAVLGDMGLLYTTQVRFWGCRWYVPHTTTIHFQSTFGSFQHGTQTAQANFNLLIAARWRMRASDGSYTYHLHRQPIGETYLTSGEWSSTGRTQQQTRMNTYIGQGIYRTATGSLITTGELGDLPIKWQLRHGTKRRRSRFWAP